jgi:hypothetical protein
LDEFRLIRTNNSPRRRQQSAPRAAGFLPRCAKRMALRLSRLEKGFILLPKEAHGWAVGSKTESTSAGSEARQFRRRRRASKTHTIHFQP